MAWLTRPPGRSCPCNGELIKYFRARRQWTQAELANAAGLTTRAIAKAEASQPVDPDTLEFIAMALSTKQHDVFPEDLCTEPRLLALRFLKNYAEHERDVVSKCRDFIHDDIEVTASGNPNIIPFSGVHHGVEEFHDFWQKFFDVFSRPDKTMATEPTMLCQDGNDVLVTINEQVKIEGYPLGPPAPVTLTMKFERGKMVLFRDYFESVSVESVLLAVKNGTVEDHFTEFQKYRDSVMKPFESDDDAQN